MWNRVRAALWYSVLWTFTGWHLSLTILYIGVVGVCFIVEFMYPVGLMLLAMLAAYMLLVALFKYLRDKRAVSDEG